MRSHACQAVVDGLENGYGQIEANENGLELQVLVQDGLFEARHRKHDGNQHVEHESDQADDRTQAAKNKLDFVHFLHDCRQLVVLTFKYRFQFVLCFLS